MPVRFDPSTAGSVEGNLASGIVPEERLLAFKELITDEVTQPAPLVIALLFSDIFAVPLKETPAIVLAVCNCVAVAAFPEQAAEVPELVIQPAPFVIALLLRDIFADPSKLTPAMVLAVASFVAVAALPVQDPDDPDVFPVTFPVRFPEKVEVIVPPTLIFPLELRTNLFALFVSSRNLNSPPLTTMAQSEFALVSVRKS